MAMTADAPADGGDSNDNSGSEGTSDEDQTLTHEQEAEIMSQHNVGMQKFGEEAIMGILPMVMAGGQDGGNYDQVLMGLVMKAAASVRLGTCTNLGDYASLFMEGGCMSDASTALFKVYELVHKGKCEGCASYWKAECVGATVGYAVCLKAGLEICAAEYTLAIQATGHLVNAYRLSKIASQGFDEATCQELASSCMPVTNQVGGFIKYTAMAKCGNIQGLIQGAMSGELAGLFRSSTYQGITKNQIKAQKELVKAIQENKDLAIVLQEFDDKTVSALSSNTLEALYETNSKIPDSFSQYITGSQITPKLAELAGQEGRTSGQEFNEKAVSYYKKRYDPNTRGGKQQPTKGPLDSFVSAITSEKFLIQLAQAKMQQSQQQQNQQDYQQRPTDHGVKLVGIRYIKNTQPQATDAANQANTIAGAEVANPSPTTAAVVQDQDNQQITPITLDSSEYEEKGVEYCHPNKACLYSMNFYYKEIDLLQFYKQAPAVIHKIEDNENPNIYIVKGEDNKELKNLDGITYELDKQGETKILATYKLGALIQDEDQNTIWLAPGTTKYKQDELQQDTNYYETNTNFMHIDSDIVIMPTKRKTFSESITTIGTQLGFNKIGIKIGEPLPRPGENNVAIYDTDDKATIATRGVYAKIDLIGYIKGEEPTLTQTNTLTTANVIAQTTTTPESGVLTAEVIDKQVYGSADIVDFIGTKVYKEYEIKDDNNNYLIKPNTQSTEILNKNNKKIIQKTNDNGITKQDLTKYQKSMLELKQTWTNP